MMTLKNIFSYAFGKITLLVLALSLAILSSSAVSAQPIRRDIRYMYSFNAQVSGTRIIDVADIYVDNKNEEIYILDSFNARVVITDLEGIYLYDFASGPARVRSPSYVVAAENGDIYLGGEREVVVLNYKGKFKRRINLSTIPDFKTSTVKSMDAEDDRLYLGVVTRERNPRIVVMDQHTGNFIEEFDMGYIVNAKFGMTRDMFYVLDPSQFKVYSLSRIDGNIEHYFGKVSGLEGGFSMPVDISVSGLMGWVLVADANRVAAIVFDTDGIFLFELGGTGVFASPTAIAADKYGKVFVGDAGHVRVFKIIVLEEETEPVFVSIPEPVEEPEPVDEVERMVREEHKLLPVHFDVDKFKLTDETRKILRKDAKWLNQNPEVKIRVRGYADPTGTDAYNLKLSKKRAQSVMGYLAMKGVAPERLVVVPLGEVTVDDADEQVKAEARRVDFFVVREEAPVEEGVEGGGELDFDDESGVQPETPSTGDASGEGSPGEAAPEEVAPEEAAPEETPADEAAPEEVAPEKAAPGEAPPEEVAPEETPAEDLGEGGMIG